MPVQPGEGDTTRAVDQKDDPPNTSRDRWRRPDRRTGCGGGADQQPATEAAPEAPPVVPAGAGTAATAAAVPPDPTGRKDLRGGRIRRIGVGVLVVLFAIFLPLSYVVTWAHYVVLTNRGFEKTVIPIGTDPAVTSAVAVTITDQIFTSLNPQQIVANALPPRAAFLAGPITNAARGYVQDGVTRALQSSQFQALWKQAVDFAHDPVVVGAQRQQQGDHHHQRSGGAQPGAPLRCRPAEPAGLHLGSGGPAGPAAVDQRQRGPRRRVPADRRRPESAGFEHLRPDSALSRGQADPGPPRRAGLQRDHGAAPCPHRGGGRRRPVVVPAASSHPAATLRRRPARPGRDPPGGGLALDLSDQHRARPPTRAPAGPSSPTCSTSTSASAAGSSSAWLWSSWRPWSPGPTGGPEPCDRLVARWAREGWNLVVAISGRARDDRTIEWVRAHLDLLRILGVARGRAAPARPVRVVDRLPGDRRPAGRLRVVAAPSRAIPTGRGRRRTEGRRRPTAVGEAAESERSGTGRVAGPAGPAGLGPPARPARRRLAPGPCRPLARP